jgi:hypothetical protein
MKLLIMKFSPLPCYLVPLRPNSLLLLSGKNITCSEYTFYALVQFLFDFVWLQSYSTMAAKLCLLCFIWWIPTITDLSLEENVM